MITVHVLYIQTPVCLYVLVKKQTISVFVLVGPIEYTQNTKEPLIYKGNLFKIQLMISLWQYEMKIIFLYNMISGGRWTCKIKNKTIRLYQGSQFTQADDLFKTILKCWGPVRCFSEGAAKPDSQSLIPETHMLEGQPVSVRFFSVTCYSTGMHM